MFHSYSACALGGTPRFRVETDAAVVEGKSAEIGVSTPFSVTERVVW